MIKLKEKIRSGFGDFASSMFWKIFAMHISYFYTDVAGLTPESVAFMFIMVRLWDGINDPLMGVIADRTSTCMGKFRPYLLWVAVPFGAIGVLTFTVPELNQAGKLIYAYITYTLMMMVYTAINVPYGSLMAVMTNKPEERTSLASFRFIGAYSGGIVMTTSAPYLLEYFGNTLGTEAKAYQASVFIYAIIAAFFFIMTYKWTKERVKTIKQKSSVKNDLKDLVRNGQWFITLGAGILMLVFITIREANIMYYFKYYVQSQEVPLFGMVDWEKLSGAYMTVWLVANMVGVLLAIPISSRLGKKSTFMCAMFISAILSFLMYILQPDDIIAIFTLNFLNGMSAGIVLPLVWSMYADIADYSEWKTGRRAIGLLFSSSSMSQKLGLMAGGALPLYILSAYGFEANTAQTPEAIEGIRMTISVYAGLMALVSGLLFTLYKLTRSNMEKITEELARRREEYITTTHEID
ncbi:MAG: MFS transporter [Bacteroidales bacterium]